MKKIPPVWNFIKNKGKWTHELNNKFLFYMLSTYGLPAEMTCEEINNYTPKERVNSIFKDWVSFTKRENISVEELDSIRENNLKNKEEFMGLISKTV